MSHFCELQGSGVPPSWGSKADRVLLQHRTQVTWCWLLSPVLGIRGTISCSSLWKFIKTLLRSRIVVFSTAAGRILQPRPSLLGT